MSNYLKCYPGKHSSEDQITHHRVVVNLNLRYHYVSSSENISSRSSSNSEANASELLEDLEDMRIVSWSVSNYCMYIVLTAKRA